MGIVHARTDSIVCPWCGYVYDDSWEITHDGELECRLCERRFDVYLYPYIIYTTVKAAITGKG